MWFDKISQMGQVFFKNLPTFNTGLLYLDNLIMVSNPNHCSPSVNNILRQDEMNINDLLSSYFSNLPY